MKPANFLMFLFYQEPLRGEEKCVISKAIRHCIHYEKQPAWPVYFTHRYIFR